MRRCRVVLVPALLLLLLAACGGEDEPVVAGAQVTDLGADPQVQETESAPARYAPPPGVWRVRSASLAPGEWYEEYASEDGTALMRVNVFPIRGSRAPAVVVRLAIDAFLRSLGVEGFGTGGQKTLSVWGAAAAQTSWTAAVGAQTVIGGARLVRVSDEHWAFAVGYVDRAMAKERQPVVRAFIDSLEPATPVFYARRFFDPKDLDLVAARPSGEAPVTMRDLLAVELVLEAGAGRRFPLSTRAAVRAGLREDLVEKDPSTRTAYRETGAAYERSSVLEPAARLQGLRALGGRALQGLLARAGKGYTPAMRIAGVWKRLRAGAVGTRDDGLSVGDVRCLHEEAAFLASLATNREVRAVSERGDRIAADLEARWAEIPAEEKAALRAAGVRWARLRQAWDAAPEAARTRVRRLAAARLAPAAERPAVAGLPTDHDLMRWMDALPADAPDGFVLRAAALTRAERASLLQPLDLEAATGWDLGW